MHLSRNLSSNGNAAIQVLNMPSSIKIQASTITENRTILHSCGGTSKDKQNETNVHRKNWGRKGVGIKAHYIIGSPNCVLLPRKKVWKRITKQALLWWKIELKVWRGEIHWSHNSQKTEATIPPNQCYFIYHFIATKCTPIGQHTFGSRVA